MKVIGSAIAFCLLCVSCFAQQQEHVRILVQSSDKVQVSNGAQSPNITQITGNVTVVYIQCANVTFCGPSGSGVSTVGLLYTRSTEGAALSTKSSALALGSQFANDCKTSLGIFCFRDGLYDQATPIMRTNSTSYNFTVTATDSARTDFTKQQFIFAPSPISSTRLALSELSPIPTKEIDLSSIWKPSASSLTAVLGTSPYSSATSSNSFGSLIINAAGVLGNKTNDTFGWNSFSANLLKAVVNNSTVTSGITAPYFSSNGNMQGIGSSALSSWAVTPATYPYLSTPTNLSRDGMLVDTSYLSTKVESGIDQESLTQKIAELKGSGKKIIGWAISYDTSQ